MSWLAEEILSNPRFAQLISAAMQKALETKGRFDRNVQTLLGLLNLPSHADLRRLQTRLDAVQGSLTNLSLKVDRLVAAEDHRRRRRVARALGAADPPQDD